MTGPETTATRRSDTGDEVSLLGARLAGKYMTFKLAEEIYGVEILKVRDLNRMMEITRVPGVKPFIRGVINLRGKVIPVIDLRQKFEMGRITEGPWTVIIVVQCELAGGELTMGILVDEVLEVLDVGAAQIEPPPNFGTGTIDTEFILGVGIVEERVIFLVDIGRVLTVEESEQLERTARANANPAPGGEAGRDA